MATIESVNFDNFIPQWSTYREKVRFHILVLVVEGSVVYDIEGEQVIAQQGDFLYIPISTTRAGSNHPSGPHRKYTVIFQTDPAFAAGIPFLEKARFVKRKLRNVSYLLHRFERLFEEMRDGGALRSYICLGIFQEMIGWAAREMERPEAAPMKRRYAETMKRYVLEHYREPVDIGRLAGLIGKSPNYAIAAFRETFGCPPIQYMHQLRITEGCNLLLTSDMSVNDIAIYLGYYDASYFFRMFKRSTGLSPSDFAQRGRGEPPAE
ncbi:AraC family transcriptional regulator [Paenibacillus sp. TRM 82003]|nr:AraC family transcriptional regulator [Paenibacillus sp. TRM 82003]